MDNDGNDSQEREEDKGTTMSAMTMVAVGGMTPKDNETGTSAAMAPGMLAALTRSSRIVNVRQKETKEIKAMLRGEGRAIPCKTCGNSDRGGNDTSI